MIWEQCSPKLKLGENETRHNIDIAPRVDALEVDDSVRFNGEYVWNEKAASSIGRTTTRAAGMPQGG